MDVRRELAFLFAGAVLGALVTVVIEEFQAQKPSVIILIASVVILTWLTLLSVLLIGPLHLVLSSPEGFSLGGEWEGSFRYTKDNQQVIISESLAVRQRGRFVQGRSRSTSVSGNFPLASTMYEFNAELRAEGVLDGTWQNTVPGQRFHGSFQAKVRRNGRAIIGTWIGVDESGIHRGEFEWMRSP